MSSILRHKQLTKLALDFHDDKTATDYHVFNYLKAIDTPRSLTVWLLYSSKSKEDSDSLTELACSPENYLNADSFSLDYAATKFLSKASFLKTTFDKKKVALEKFQKFEELCARTNCRFRNLSLDPQFKGPNVWLLNATKLKIGRILGDFSADEFVDDANWGPGVTTKLKGSYVSAINKFHLENGITRDLHSLVGGFFEAAYPIWSSHLTHLYGSEKWDFQIGNKIVTVPKDSKADRVIAVEPGINLWFQKAIGTMIRRRLRKVSIDLNTQSINQALCRTSSYDGYLATVDFSSASDSISLELVRELLPSRWFQLMDSCRSKYGCHNAGAHWWEKFSSMGNGFTFELESLIFFCAAEAVQEYHGMTSSVSVFGDDVLLAADCCDAYSLFCEFLGFKVNMAKSFKTGPFRESCGAHFFNGYDCKPIFLKERVLNVQSVFKLANAIRLLSHRRNSGSGCDRRFLSVWRSVVDRLPKPLRLRTPTTLGDAGLISNFDEACPSRARDSHKYRGFEGYLAPALVQVGLTDSLDSPAVLLARLWSPSDQEDNESYTLRGRVKNRVKPVLVSQWCNLGPWY